MNKRYILGIVITVLALTVNQAFIQYWLKQKEDDAEIINISGKQRMLSQKISVLFYQNYYQNQSSELLHQTINQWKETHQNLKSKKEKEASDENAILYSKLLSLDTKIEFIVSQVDKKEISKDDLNKIYFNQQIFSNEMDEIVYLLQKDADSKLSFIIFIEYCLFAISLFIIVLEVFIIYKPISKKIKIANNKLLEKNRELNKALKDLEIKNDKLQHYIYLASHDLQEPVKNVYAIANLLDSSDNNDLDNQTKELLKLLKLKTARISNMIKELIDFHNLGINVKLEKVDLNKVLEEVVNDFKDELNILNITISWEKLPTIKVLHEEIKILFYNLVGNAIKFRNENVTPNLSLDFEEKEKYWQFWLETNSINMSIRAIEKVFDLFNKNKDNKKYSGKGITIALYERVVKMHNGKSWIESTKEKNIRFYFTIPKKIELNV